MKQRRLLIAGGLFAGSVFLIGFLGSFQMPKLRSWVLVKVEEMSRQHSPVRILPERVEIDFFPLGISLHGVRILPKEEIKETLESLSIDNIEITLSPWLLLQGRLRLADVSIQGAKISVHIPKTKKSSGPPLEGLFNALNQIPVTHFEIDDVSVHATLTEPAMDVQAENISLALDKERGGGISIDLNSASVQIQQLMDKNQRLNLGLELEGSLTASRTVVDLSSLLVRRGDSFIQANAILKGDTEALNFKEITFQGKTELQVDSLGAWALKTYPKIAKYPKPGGRAFIDVKGRKDGNKELEADFNLDFKGFRLDKMLLDHLKAAGHYQNKEIKVPSATLENIAGVVSASGFSLSFTDPYPIKAMVKTTAFQLHELLKTLGVGDEPIFAKVTGEIPCTGVFKPDFLLTCKGKAHGDDIVVNDSMKSPKTIASVKQFDITNGEVKVGEDEVTYTAELAMANSKGRSSGTIGYKTGFKIAYEADTLALKDIANLADLKIEGSAHVKGSTEGDSDAATLQMDVDLSDGWLEDFWLGNTKGNASYKAGQLAFANMQGYYTVSRYNGDVKLDLHKKQIIIAGRAPFIDAKDLLKVFSRKVKLPFAVTGTGQAQAKVSGPLEFTKLTYDLKSSLFRGSVAGENFEQANFDVKANAGEVKTERAQVLKGPTIITLVGVGHPNGTIQTVVTGKNIKIEDTGAVASSGLALSGNVDFDMDMNGPVLAPDTDMRGSITRTSIGDQPLPDSHFQMKFTAKTIEGDGTFLGDVVKANFVMPLNPTAPFALKMKTQEWNFAPIFAAIAGPDSRKDYEGHLTSNIDLTAPTGGFWNSTGFARVDRFSLARGQVALKSTEPLSLSIKNGQVHVQKFELTGGENFFLKVADKANPVTKADLQVNGKLDLTLMGLLTPFFEDLRGILSFAFNLRAGPDSADLLGSAYLEKGYLKFFEFPHPLEEIQADILFNQKKILFNTLKAELGGGKLIANGGMEIKGYKNYPVNVTGTFDKISLNVPEKIKTSGSGNFSFTGNWFPFTLKVEYDVHDGMLTKEFGGDSGDQREVVRRDFFLPRLLLEENFTPLLVDLQINLSQGILVKNSLFEGKMLGNITAKGKPGKPSILGTVTTDKDSKIYFKDTAFEVTSANIQFTDPNAIDPRLYISARARVQEYDINLVINGTGGKPEINLSSVPPLQRNDIISLLALGATDTQLNGTIKSTEQANSTGSQLVTGAIKNPFSNAIQDTLGFEVQFSSGFDDATNSAIQKVIISRQINKKLVVSGSEALGTTRETEAKLRYRLTDRFSLVGSWLGRDYSETQDDPNQPLIEKNPSKIGLDVEYKFEFK